MSVNESGGMVISGSRHDPFDDALDDMVPDAVVDVLEDMMVDTPDETLEDVRVDVRLGDCELDDVFFAFDDSG